MSYESPKVSNDAKYNVSKEMILHATDSYSQNTVSYEMY